MESCMGMRHGRLLKIGELCLKQLFTSERVSSAAKTYTIRWATTAEYACRKARLLCLVQEVTGLKSYVLLVVEADAHNRQQALCAL